MVIIACEESQTITIAMRKAGIEAYSCDLLECSGGHPEWHIQDDILKVLNHGWSMMIAHPPCTYLSSAGNGWFNEEKYGDKARHRKELRQQALDFFLLLYNSNIPKICIENPLGYINSHFRKPDQIIHPYYFGDPESKRTCLWLKNLPKLKITNLVEPNNYGIDKRGKKITWSDHFGETKDRSKIRSKTFPGLAAAMANQWGLNNVL